MKIFKDIMLVILCLITIILVLEKERPIVKNECNHTPYIILNGDTLEVIWVKDIRDMVSFKTTKQREKLKW
jgi:hypothetical protein